MFVRRALALDSIHRCLFWRVDAKILQIDNFRYCALQSFYFFHSSALLLHLLRLKLAVTLVLLYWPSMDTEWMASVLELGEDRQGYGCCGAYDRKSPPRWLTSSSIETGQPILVFFLHLNQPERELLGLISRTHSPMKPILPFAKESSAAIWDVTPIILEPPRYGWSPGVVVFIAGVIGAFFLYARARWKPEALFDENAELDAG